MNEPLSRDRTARKSSLRNWFFTLLLMLIGIGLPILILEAGLRVRRRDFQFHSRLSVLSDLFRSAYPAAYDPDLGWVPTPTKNGQPNIWRTKVEILSSTLRSNGRPPISGGASAVIAVGDSYTFGDEVSDEETWPAILESLTQTATLNGGVFGYGVDQAALRAKKLMKQFNSSVVVLSLIPDDISRVEYSERTGVRKPVFSLRQGMLVLDGIPVPQPESYRPRGFLTTMKEETSRSALIHEGMLRISPAWWLHGTWADVRVHSDGDRVACRVLIELAKDTQNAGIGLIVLAQYRKEDLASPSDISRMDRLRECIGQERIVVLDLLEVLRAFERCDPTLFGDLYSPARGHMTKAGNTVVAKVLRPVVEAALKLPTATGALNEIAASAQKSAPDGCALTRLPKG